MKAQKLFLFHGCVRPWGICSCFEIWISMGVLGWLKLGAVATQHEGLLLLLLLLHLLPYLTKERYPKTSTLNPKPLNP